MHRSLIASPVQRHLLVAAAPAALTTAALSAPLLSAFGYTLSAFAIVQFFSVVCHQDPARSFWIVGAPVAVCARCLGIYLGAVAGAWITAPRGMILRLLAATVLVSMLDFLAESAGLHGNWPLMRCALGGILGASISALVMASANPHCNHLSNTPFDAYYDIHPSKASAAK
ncbi:MAG: DUF2085 domain-containing protein [Terriglobales bacterium]